jgi:hypothetical protein
MHCRRRGEIYATALQAAIIETLPDGSFVFDADHAAWAAAVENYREAGHLENPPSSPCRNCGDKTNAAQVKASPAAMENMLRG